MGAVQVTGRLVAHCNRRIVDQRPGNGDALLLDAGIPARVVGVFADYHDDTDLAYSVMASWPLVKERLNGRPEDQPFENTNGSTHCFALFNDRFTGSILWLFNRESLQLVGIAFFLSAPVAWWVMKGWLSNFEYRISLGPAIFLPTLVATLVIALITVSFQSVKAAVTNPVKSLRGE